jgi:hypothetical protein
LFGICSRLGGLCALLTIAAALMGAAPALATVTTTHVTTPGNPTFLQWNEDAVDQATFNIVGTSDGTTGDQVDVNCYDADGDVDAIAAAVPVQNDGSFSVPNANVSDCANYLWTIRAVPNGADVNSGAFTGPTFGVGSRAYSYNGVGRYNYDFVSVTADEYSVYNSVSGFSLADSQLFDSSMAGYEGLWASVDALNVSNRDGDSSESEITVDGHDAYTPGGAYYTNSAGVGPPAMSVTEQMDPATGELTIHETDPLVFCGDGSGNIADPPSGSPPTCPGAEFLAAPVTLTRTITESQDGRQTTISDAFSSTDGASHTLETSYEDNLNSGYTRFPGESAYTEHADGATPSVATSGPATIFVEEDPTIPAGTDNVQGAIVYSTPPDRAVFVGSGGEHLQLQYTSVVPAAGSVDLTHTYLQGFDQAALAASASTVVDAAQSPSVSIAAPANDAVVTTEPITITGTASDNAGVSSLTVNGLPTAVNPDGTWSQTLGGLAPGANPVTAVAQDATGNSTQVSQTVIYSPPAAVPPPTTGATTTITTTTAAPTLPPVTTTTPIPSSCTVPKVAGRPSSAAGAAIVAANCTVGHVTSTPSSTAATGTVLRQSRPAGSLVSLDYPIDLVLSSGTPGKAKAVSTATLQGNRLAIKLTCPRRVGNPCSGAATIRTTTTLHGHDLRLGPRDFTVRAGHSQKVVFTLRSGLASAIHRAHTVRSILVLRGSANSSGSLTIQG